MLCYFNLFDQSPRCARQLAYHNKVACTCPPFQRNNLGLHEAENLVFNMAQQDLLTPVASLSGIEHRYPGGETLRFADLTIPTGQHTLILGNSGSGKTTLLHILTGLLKPLAGSVQNDGQELYDLTPGNGYVSRAAYRDRTSVV